MSADYAIRCRREKVTVLDKDHAAAFWKLHNHKDATWQPEQRGSCRRPRLEEITSLKLKIVELSSLYLSEPMHPFTQPKSASAPQQLAQGMMSCHRGKDLHFTHSLPQTKNLTESLSVRKSTRYHHTDLYNPTSNVIRSVRSERH